MGAIPGLLGVNGGAGGTGFDAPQGVNFMQPVTQSQLDDSYTGVQGGLTEQQKLLDAIKQQNGLQNQTQVYNQMQDVAAGKGPNPAQAMLNQQTGANVSNQAALMAGQRGASQNVGMIARQAAQQGAATQQQAVGQGATMQANQSLNAMGAAGNMANTMAGNQVGATGALSQAQLQRQQAMLNATSQYNNTRAGMQSNINNIQGQLANTTLQGQQATVGGIMSMAGGASGMMGAEGGDVGEADTSTPTFGSDAGAGALEKGFEKAGGGGGGGGGGGSSGPNPMMLAMLAADGGSVTPGAYVSQGPQSSLGMALQGMPSSSAPMMEMDHGVSFGSSSGAAAIKKGGEDIGKALSKKKDPQSTGGAGGNTSGGGDAGGGGGGFASKMMGASMEAKGGQVRDFRQGGAVKAKSAAEKAVAKGNSYSNDKIPAVLSDKEIVLPREVTMSSDPINDSAKFVQAVLAKRRMRK